jgi:hypothetical protein
MGKNHGKTLPKNIFSKLPQTVARRRATFGPFAPSYEKTHSKQGGTL